MSTILYKFRASTQYTPLHLPGTSARLLDIKRAIVRDKKLDSASGAPSSLEFDLQISNAATDEVYTDEMAIIPRGTRVVVRRVACERGRGILNRLAGGDVNNNVAPTAADKSEFYTFRQGTNDDDEFVDDTPATDETKELEALKAVTDQAGEVYQQRGWSGAGPSRGGAPHFPKPPSKQQRPDADPEWRMQQPKPKKRATTGIPRTFLSEAPSRGADGEAPSEEEGAELATTLLPNAHAFQSLIARSGGKSSNDTTNNLSYALKLTSTPLPDHLTCGICQSLVQNAMLVPWDDQGRPACESCIRDGLMQNGYKCPMTGVEGVSPEDLFPNVGLRKAAEVFERRVWEKVGEMEKSIEEEQRIEEKRVMQEKSKEEFDDEGDGIVKRKNKEKKKRVDDFGEDEFGGDVFDVTEDPAEEENDAIVEDEETKVNTSENVEPSETKKDNHNKLVKESSNAENGTTTTSGDDKEEEKTDTSNTDTVSNTDKEADATRKQPPKRRGPPAGYVLGPAGGMGMMAAPPPIMFGVNCPPPPPPPPRPNPKPSADANQSDNGSNNGSRSGSIDLSSGPTPGEGMPGHIPGTPPPMGRGRGGDGRFPGRFNDYSRGGFPGRERFNNFQGGRGAGNFRDYGGRGGGRNTFQGRGFGRGNPNWGSNDDWNRKRPRDVMDGDPSGHQDQGRGNGGRGYNPHQGRFEGRGRFQGRDGGGRGRFEGRGWRGGGRNFGRGRY